ncbi:16S rRNA (cytosine(1402)-N(4))-methyltransferase RsmH [Aerococcus urinae]|uniref:16S rRNA (cytosine(1402)-N(4))-methyltransferase RsmH n=1 Tax=Aerococcus urinae TaxID=1376 RepID=UPI0018E10B8D|nr:16S rRNA (cytosine(1402)-N(4))-methyltransferase RsmH [Aerococcus urinae]
MSETFHHITVLLKETVDALNVKEDGSYVDCTLGGGGHTSYLLSKLSTKGRLYAFDQDIQAINHAKDRFADAIDAGQLTLIHANFAQIEEELAQRGVKQVDGILYDLGVSSPQLDDRERGFSYKQDAPLDMRMDQSQSLTAKEVVNEWSYADLVRILKRYGEEKFAKAIARNIENHRQKATITRTAELVEIIKEAIPAPARRKGGHPAKRSFQAIRIAVNDELGAIESSLSQALQLIKVEGRIAAISFQSLEDRIVKVMFKEASTVHNLPSQLPLLESQLPQAKFRLVNKKPIYPSQEELDKNSRAQSAKLRAIERVSE